MKTATTTTTTTTLSSAATVYGISDFVNIQQPRHSFSSCNTHATIILVSTVTSLWNTK
jgi:hypothetical protein